MNNWEAYTRRLAKKYRIPFFPNQIRQESGFDPNAVSPAGARGIAQIMPGTAQGWGVDPMNPRAALDAAARHMREYVDRYGVRGALIAYNAGPGRVGSRNLPTETQNYIRSILGNNQGRSQAPANVNDASRDAMLGSVLGSTRDAPQEPTVFDVIRQYRNATEQRNEDKPLFEPFDAQKSGTQIQNTVQRILKIRNQTSQAMRTGDATGMGPSDRNEAVGALAGMVKEADRLDKLNNAGKLPYLWGGGHGDSGANGLDCSGAVSRVLGIDPRVAQDFMQWGQGGRGKRVTIYANAEHVLMEINGHFFGTSRSNPQGGAGWIPASAVPESYLRRFVARHPRGM